MNQNSKLTKELTRKQEIASKKPKKAKKDGDITFWPRKDK